jgi:hypothetical protein
MTATEARRSEIGITRRGHIFILRYDGRRPAEAARALSRWVCNPEVDFGLGEARIIIEYLRAKHRPGGKPQ